MEDLRYHQILNDDVAMDDTDIIDDAVATHNDQDEPTNWVEECYRDNTLCNSVITGVTKIETTLNNTCATTTTLSNNNTKPICNR